MPRNLTDLMERATSFAPPEPHAAGDITRMAAHRQRRRTTGIAAGLAATVLVAAAAGYGVTRGHATTPEPAGEDRYGQELEPSDVVPADSLPGYQALPWAVPSVERLTDPHLSPLLTYLGVDAEGRLLVESVPSRQPRGRMSVQLYETPDSAPTVVPQPPSPGDDAGRPIQWIPSFGGDDRLIWRPDIGVLNGNDGYRVTDLAGGHDMLLPSKALGISGFGLRQFWVSGDTVWFLTDPRGDDSGAVHYNLSISSLTHPQNPTIVAHDVLLADVDDETAGWLTADGHVFTEDARGGSAREVTVPYGPGCRMPQAGLLGITKAFVVGPSTVALTERCRVGQGTEAVEVLAFDTSGRLLMHLSRFSAFSLAMGDGSLAFDGLAVGSKQFQVMHYDLRTGVLAALPYRGTKSPDLLPEAAGDYVLWYDGHGGHVARIPQ